MFFKSKKSKLIFYLSIVVIIIIFIVIRDSSYIPQTYSLHLVSGEERGNRIVVFEERGEFVGPLWERASYYADRVREENIPPKNKDYFFEIFFSEGQDLLARKGRFVIYPDRIIVDNEKKKLDARDFFAYCENVIRSRNALFSLLTDAEFVELREPDQKEGIFLSRQDVDEFLARLTGLQDGQAGNAPLSRELNFLLEIPEGKLFVLYDNKMVFSFWGGYWHYEGAGDIEEFFQALREKIN